MCVAVMGVASHGWRLDPEEGQCKYMVHLLQPGCTIACTWMHVSHGCGYGGVWCSGPAWRSAAWLQEQEVLNELVIDRGSSSFLTNIECYEKGRYITRVQADGIMLATPTGEAWWQAVEWLALCFLGEG